MSTGDPPRPPGFDSSSARSANSAFPRPFGQKYQLLAHLATGGMADVFLARQLGDSGFVKECVIKRILPHLAGDPQFVNMFLDEARLCARLNHPNIAQVYDHGRLGEDYFIAMEYVDGVDLEQLLDRNEERGEPRLPPAIAARIVAGVAEGLAHAHNAVDEHGQPLHLVHRDVTPSNVVVSFEGVPKLLDFGIAKAESKLNKTEVGVIKGKVPYMSPEQVQGDPVDARSDLFALGTILYELTTGAKPFRGDNAAQMGLRILHDEPTPPTLIIADYPETLETIVQAALTKPLAERVQTARAFQLQIERFLVEAGTPVTSYDVAAYLARRFERKPIHTLAQVTPATAATVLAKPPGDRSIDLHGTQPDLPSASSWPDLRLTGEQGPMTLGDGALLDGDERPDGRRRQRRGGGPWLGVVIGALVAAVGVGFVLLRSMSGPSEAANLPVTEAAKPVARPVAQPVAAQPVVAQPKPVAAQPKPAAAQPKPAAAQPVTQAKPVVAARQPVEKASPPKPAPKPVVAAPHHAAAHRTTADHDPHHTDELPRLPRLPEASGEAKLPTLPTLPE